MAKVLIVSSRFPWPAYTGDRMRASIWVSALAPHARVALVAPAGEVPKGTPAFGFYPAARSLANGVRGGMRIVSEGLPLQCLLAAPYDWETAIAAARREEGTFDAAVVMLARADPWVRESLNGETTILDAVDSLRRNAEERGAASAVSGWFWRREARRLAKAELDAGRVYDHVVVVSGEETSEFGGAAVAIANSVRVTPLDAQAPRRYDFGFWGRLPYFANADAAAWLLDEIWPAIQARNPSATMVIGGADAPRSLRRKAEHLNIPLVSPVGDLAAFARSVRVAIVPMRYGSGQSSKLLEAAEGGCAIVTTPQALRGLAPLAPHVSVAGDAASLANAALDLLANEERRRTSSAALRQVVATHYSRALVLEQLAAMAGVSSREARA